MPFEASLNSLIPRPKPFAKSGIRFAPKNNNKTAIIKIVSVPPKPPRNPNRMLSIMTCLLPLQKYKESYGEFKFNVFILT